MSSYNVRDINLGKEVDRLEKDIQQLKAAQLTGFDVNSIKESTTSSSYDVTIASGGSPVVKTWTFTSDRQEGVGGVFIAHVTKDGLVTPALDADFDFTIQDLTHYQSNPRVVRAMSNIYNNSSSTLYFKIYFYGTDTGTVTIA